MSHPLLRCALALVAALTAISGLAVWSDDRPAADAQVLVHGATEDPVAVDAEGRFGVTLPYGSRFMLRATGRRLVNGREHTAFTPSPEIDRTERKREVRVVLEVPR